MKNGLPFNEDDVENQQKKKTIFSLERAFPFLNNRSEVVSSEDIILNPIECAIETIQQRVNFFRAEVFTSPVRKNNLQALLTGTLATTVHVGPLKFCEVFLNNSSYSVESRDVLRDSMAELLMLAKAGLQINAGIIGSEQLAFHEMLENKFHSAMQTFQESHAGSVRWAKINSAMQENEKRARQDKTDFEKKIKLEEEKAFSK